tara:strand:+ start:66 stop:1163 length:1098 start_codon:yes stop_codon:yes gene_type:complete
MNKRGVSAIITMVLIIMIVVVSIVIIWAVIRPIVEKTGEGAEDGQFSVVLQIEDFEVKPNGDISLIVSRGASGPDLPSLKVFVFDGTDTTTFTTEGLDKMQTKKLTLPSGGLVKEISVAPVFESSGDEKIGNVGARLKFSNKEILKNHGAVAWWRFEGNADDEIRGHDGTLLGDVHCDVLGKYGNGCYFDGLGGGSEDDGVQIGGSENSEDFSDLSNGFTYSAWIKMLDYEEGYSMIMGSGAPWFGVLGPDVGNYRKLEFGVSTETTPSTYLRAIGETDLELDTWYHVVASLSSSLDMRVWLNGNQDVLLENQNSLGAMTGYDEYIGNWHPSNNYLFNGTIDEPMFFNRGLTQEEVKSLYNLDLS